MNLTVQQTDAAILDWVLPVMQGDDDLDTNAKTAALVGALLMGDTGRDAVVIAMKGYNKHKEMR